MKHRLSIITMFYLVIASQAMAQESFPVNGVQDERLESYAFTNATIFTNYQTRLEKATLLIKNGVVVAVGTNVSIPKGAIVQDLDGKYIYPAFVDPYSSYGMPEVKEARANRSDAPQMESKKAGAYGWNEAIKAEINAADVFKLDADQAQALKEAGFGAVIAHHPDGIVRGTSALITLNEAPEQNALVRKNVGANFSFSRGSSAQYYPNSIMGAAALVRQTYYDAMWYSSSADVDQTNLSLDAFNKLKGLPAVFTTENINHTLLADKVGDEFGVQYLIQGAGDEYQKIPQLKATGARMIIPVNFPEAYDIDDPYEALNISYRQLKHWELAPKNPALLAENGISFSFTSNGLKDMKDFMPNVRSAVKHGLSESEALKALTYNPAVFLQVSDKVGSLEKGKIASFIIASDNIFNDDAKIHATWSNGEGFEVNPLDLVDFSGKYALSVGSESYEMEVSGSPGGHVVKLIKPDTSINLDANFEGMNVTIVLKQSNQGYLRLSGYKTEKNLSGSGKMPNGQWVDWSATYKEPLGSQKSVAGKVVETPQVGPVIYPFVAFGSASMPVVETVLIRNATVWTNEEAGILANTDVLLKDGKIAAVGKNLDAIGATVIDGSGKHVTSGIVDEHSHTALMGVNESSEASTAEVRMYDAVEPDDIDIYRQLAGGVTAAQLLHGSANPIGGQSAIVKFRWGKSAEEMAISGSDGFIKFALGENVKQSNRPPAHNIRFPQTRMGVEQVFVDAFTRAKAYDQAWKSYNSLSSKQKAATPAPRRDLDLETLAQILNGERFISCHSYVQSEINMLMKVAEQFGFRVNTFTHILEGYKVADKMAEHGVGGSTFADWWAYKFEVREAIPYNAALMHSVGVVTAINSDDSEMARRLNQEAAKTIKYGDVSEEEALKMVTLNPAKLLHLDDRMGSIKVGKDADVVVWSGHPLSIYTKAERTFVDGVRYFDIDRDLELRKEMALERERIVAKMKNNKSGKPGSKVPGKSERRRWECEDEVDYMYKLENN